MSDVHDTSYYLKCMLGGVLACGVTHAAICPLDIVKCRKQVSSALPRHRPHSKGTRCRPRIQNPVLI